MENPITLSHEFQEILNQLESSTDHFFITGKAGTGKSTLLQLFRNTSAKKLAVLAPTGIAALNVRGQTIHSFFKFAPRILNKSEITKRMDSAFYRKFDAFIIDEISMVRADVLDNIDYFLRLNRRNNLPFGGAQMIFFGDLFQLPPVIATPFERNYFQTQYQSPYFFSANVWTQASLKKIELTQVYRQEARQFINLLDAIRLNQLEWEDIALLNERFVPLPEDKAYYITLCSRNDTANKINEDELKAIPNPSFTYIASIIGEFNPQLFPTEFNLVLKKGAQVMFVKNDINKQYVNGTIGIIDEIDDDKICVKISDIHSDEKIIEVEKQEWEILKYQQSKENPNEITTTVIGQFTQYPLKLAWAITIHKSQGKTFHKIIIDLGGGAFESGQTYVALSRCTTLDGIILTKPVRPRDIIVDERISQYYNDIKYLN